jgi:superfamily II DNA/RNA helicase
MTLPVALAGQDVIGQAKTGTGKTLGFGIPLLQRLIGPHDSDAEFLAAPGKPQALVVVPTRELCIQVAQDLRQAGARRAVRVLEIYGGRAYEPQIDALRTGVDVVVGTPGRLIDLAQQRHLDLTHVKVLVLDEADEMLDLGFLPDVERIVALTPDNRQTMLFSATMPGVIVNLARRYMRQPTHIRATNPADESATVDTVEQHIYRAHEMDKPELLARVLQARGRGLTIVFCRTKRACDRVAADLTERGFAAAAVHGDLGQGAREQALRAFRSGKVDVLVATDVAARGIDVEGVTHVVNYTCPEDEKTYLHRVGRTARAGNEGVAITLVDWADVPRWSLINKMLGLAFFDPPETYSTSPWLYTALDIPADATGRLPRAERTRAGLAAEEIEDLGETGRGRRAGGGPHRGSSGSGSRGSRSARDDREPTGPDRADAVAGDADAPRPPRKRTGPRRRTRAGQDVSAGAAAGTDSASTDSTSDGPAAPRRRRRRRGGAGSGGSAGGAGSASSVPTPTAGASSADD